MTTRSMAGQDYGDVSGSIFSETARLHMREPQNMGVLEPPCRHATRTGECGDRMDFWVDVADGIVTRLSFTTSGCGSSQACASMTTVLALGKSIEAAMTLESKDVLAALGDFPESSAHCAALSIETLHAACVQWLQSESLGGIARTLMVLSGKGGVGKTTLVANLAANWNRKGFKVGVLDIDLHGPNLPTLLGMDDEIVEREGDRLRPADSDGLKLMSMAFLLPDPDQAVLWKGMKKGILVQQFLQEVDWGDLDVLIIDAPAGTGDEPIAAVKTLGTLSGAIVVTTAQRLALQDARKALNFCKEMDVPLLGLVENQYQAAGQGAREMAMDMDLPLLASLPMDPVVAQSAEEGTPFVLSHPESEASWHLDGLACRLEELLGMTKPS
jgi:ATP-binding protein involved in chromosome partitioning